MMIKAIALDDEFLALSIISNYADNIDFLSLEKTFTSQKEALKHLHKFPVDLIFLDIEMPNTTGLDFCKNLPPNCQVIFTTAYAEYAVEAFAVNAVDYLLKPFSFERFLAAVQKVKQEPQAKEEQYLSIRADYKLHRLKFENILLIEGLDDYVKFHLKNAPTITARSSLKNVLEKLPSSEFIRVHRSFIVPVSNIKSYVNKNLHIGDFVIPVGDTYKNDLRRFLSENS